uniref:ABC transporter domain-containing protein n=1 Tax=Meloidogyne hapla TaxID=6305 RepID=A0A1I8BB22_MELHA
MRTRLGYNLRASFSSLAASQWLSVRIQMLGLCVLTVILFASILDVTIFKLSHPGLIGLAITYALSLTNVLNALLTSFIETEKELVSVERICDYVDNVLMEEDDQLLSLQSQIDNEDDSLILPIVGHIRFESVSLRYSPELPLAINDVSFRLEAGTRTAIIGRTGAGKSTILQVLNIILVNSLCNILFKALLRAHPIENGKILIDDRIDLASLGFKSARALFGYVSQRPFLFSGTLFDNLSISNTNLNNKQIEESIAERGLSQWLEQFGGLNKIISEGGKNLSFGERQLISLLRLSLTKPKIILIDEATAHMDEHTHLLMSRLISRMGCTVIAIVHRLTGLDEHYDWVIENTTSIVPTNDFLTNNISNQQKIQSKNYTQIYQQLLNKISTHCISDREYEELYSNKLKAGLVSWFLPFLVDGGIKQIGLNEIRSKLKLKKQKINYLNIVKEEFEDKNKKDLNNTLDYLQNKIRLYSLDKIANLLFWQEDVIIAENFLDKNYPEVRKLFQLKTEEMEIEKKTFNNETVDEILLEFILMFNNIYEVIVKSNLKSTSSTPYFGFYTYNCSDTKFKVNKL